MTMKVELNEGDSALKQFISQVHDGTEIVFVENGPPVAMLSQITPRIPGLNRGSAIVSDDFDEELPDEFWLGEK
ncbi:MAG: toxin-antitoxin (TA) system antitoxin [Ignavibacteriae bacterium]|nr:toxin-antitoxin (TA) system antitoxin [Ignavibacteriota bacterium]